MIAFTGTSGARKKRGLFYLVQWWGIFPLLFCKCCSYFIWGEGELNEQVGMIEFLFAMIFFFGLHFLFRLILHQRQADMDRDSWESKLITIPLQNYVN